MILSFTEQETQYLASLLRIAGDEQAREVQNVTVQRAEQEIIEIVRSKVAQENMKEVM